LYRNKKVENVEEKCGRQWKLPVSALEFAAWSGDIHLVECLLNKVTAKYRKEALAQLEGVKQHGLEHGEMMVPIKHSIQTYGGFIETFDINASTDTLIVRKDWPDRVYAEEFVKQRQRGWDCLR
jgi:hypothetical protein